MAPYVVVDASVAGAWLFAEPYSARSQPILAALEARRVIGVCPDRFAEELLRICQKKTLPAPAGAGVPAGDAWVRFLDVMTSPLVLLPSDELHERAWNLAISVGLTSHDALYLALAERWEAELWTLDSVMAGPRAGAHAMVRDLRYIQFPY